MNQSIFSVATNSIQTSLIFAGRWRRTFTTAALVALYACGGSDADGVEHRGAADNDSVARSEQEWINDPETLTSTSPSALAEDPNRAASDEESAETQAPTEARDDSPRRPELTPQDGLSIRRLVVTRSIVDREPVTATDELPFADVPMYAFVDAANADEEDASVTITFISPTGRSVGFVDLDVPAGAPRWRTWARSRLVTAPGEWVVEARDADDRLLGRRAFRIE